MKVSKLELNEFRKLKKRSKFETINTVLALFLTILSWILYFVKPEFMLVCLSINCLILLGLTCSGVNSSLIRLYENAINSNPENIRLKIDDT